MKTMSSIEALELAIAEGLRVRPESWRPGGLMGKFWFKWDGERGWVCVYRVNGTEFDDGRNDTIFLQHVIEPWVAVSPDDLSRMEASGEGR